MGYRIVEMPLLKPGGEMVQFGGALPVVEEIRIVRGPIVVDPGKDCGHENIGFGCLSACGCCLMKAQRRWEL
jgi:hypothetical protein